MAENQTPELVMEALPEEQLMSLLPRAAGARGLSWPREPRNVTDKGGLTADLSHHPGVEAVVWATLNGKDGVLALFRGKQLLGQAGKELGRIKAVQVIRLPGLPHLALMVDDHYDARVGAFLDEERRRIYVWDGRGLRLVWEGALRREQVMHARWQNPRAPLVWRKELTEADIALRGLMLDEKRREQRLEAPGSPQAQVPAPSAFRVTGEKETARRFRWDPRLRRFDEV